MTQASISVEFGVDSLHKDTRYILDIDSDYFETVNGAPKTTYTPGDEVFLKAIPSITEEGYSLSSSLGSLSVKNVGINYTIEEHIEFINSTEGSLSNTPVNTPSYSWSTTNKGTPSFSGKKVTMSSKALGVLKVEYEAKGDRLSLTDCTMPGTDEEEEFYVICVAEYDRGTVVHTTIPFGEDDTIKDVTLVIKDVITGEVIPNATVTVGEISGTSDSNGEFIIQDLVAGNTYDISVSAANYFASGEDYLNNDTFTVPEDE